ncbi:lipopolysaccharide biosynthesis protein [Cupriavidus sp. USMAHM13]|uniref:lipopolysaccharide biosynthesis protein n=1 Tax=Cupriavidus sp. USMAHM13 TaxID=1389192 RepID=UPI0012EA808C|nr:hypothetical protein [Cupriavidus sp. USMAHM13]
MGNILLFGGVAGLSLIVNQITNIYVARHLEISEIGYYVVALLISTILGVIVDLGARMHYTTRLAKVRGPLRRAKYLRAIASCITRLNLLISVPFFVIGALIYGINGALFFGTIICLSSSLYSNAFAFSQVNGRGRVAQLSNVLMEVGRLAVVVLLSKFSNLSGFAILFSSIVSSRLIAGLFLQERLGLAFLRGNFLRSFKQTYRRASNIFFSAVMSLINVKSGEMLVAAILPAARVGELNIAMQIPAAGLRVFELVKPSFVAKLSRLSEQKFLVMLVTVISASLICVLLLSPILKEIFVLIYGEKVREVAFLFIWLACWLIVSLGNYLASIMLVVKGRSDRDLLTNKVALLISMPAYALLVQKLGLVGAVMSMCLIAFFSAILNCYWLVELPRLRNAKR